MGIKKLIMVTLVTVCFPGGGRESGQKEQALKKKKE
jgi:hypothetical protein